MSDQFGDSPQHASGSGIHRGASEERSALRRHGGGAREGKCFRERSERGFPLSLKPFDGPLDLLLQLIEQEEFDVTTVALASVCERYLAGLKAIERRSPDEVAEFLLIAAKLLYLKSLALMPTAGEEFEDTTGLTEQLRIYRAFVEAATGIAARYASGRVAYPTARWTTAMPVTFSPPSSCTGTILAERFVAIRAELEPIVRIPRAIIGRVISIDDRIVEIRELVARRAEVSFGEVLRGRRGRDQQIVCLLAILELVKQREIDVDQDERFGDIAITVRHTDPEMAE